MRARCSYGPRGGAFVVGHHQRDGVEAGRWVGVNDGHARAGRAVAERPDVTHYRAVVVHRSRSVEAARVAITRHIRVCERPRVWFDRAAPGRRRRAVV
jgi:hypothetical protein